MSQVSTNTKLSNTNDLEINPATEDKQDDIISALNGTSKPDKIIDETTTADTTYI
jgi:hypothetical protein